MRCVFIIQPFSRAIWSVIFQVLRFPGLAFSVAPAKELSTNAIHSEMHPVNGITSVSWDMNSCLVQWRQSEFILFFGGGIYPEANWHRLTHISCSARTNVFRPTQTTVLYSAQVTVHVCISWGCRKSLLKT